MGQGKWLSKYKGKSTKEYVLWLHMMTRCYSEKLHKDSPSYKNVEVCDRWKCYQNFCEDLPSIIGYQNWIAKNNVELDKDILCNEKDINPKIYSLDTCMFISKKDNVSEATTRRNLTGLTYIGLSPQGEEYEFTNIKEFSEKHNLNNSLVNQCINKTRNHHRNWIFRVK